ncbi:MAG: hypothetical protein K6E50_04575 [Lachnospiraceae bacterium]|nr:hypothetical protein [Lachnospiraceae bacterium]
MNARKISLIMLKLLDIAPFIAAAVFAILFTCVFHSRIEERILHSATTFLLWMFASLFYIMILADFRKAKKVMAGAAGMLVFIALAILVTPLDRYVSLVFARSRFAAYALALIMGTLFLLISKTWRKKVEG